MMRLLRRCVGPDGGRVASLVVFLLTSLLLLWLLPAQGLTDDDDYYAPAGIQYAEWIGSLVTHPSEALTRDAIDRAFRFNHEHPPFAKYLIGGGHALTHRLLGVLGSLDGARTGIVFFSALLCALLVRLLWRPLGPGTALLAPALLLSLPRFLFHSQVATLDVAVATMVVFTTAAFFWAERDPRWNLPTGVVFGLALLTKLNAPFAALPAAFFTVLTRWRGFHLGRTPKLQGPAVVLPPVPGSLLAMLLLGPVLFVGLWPWLWFDTLERLREYFAFHLAHYPIFLFYEGEIYSKPFAPWHMPFTLAGGVMPSPVVFMGLVGGGLAFAALLRTARAARTEGSGSDASDDDQLLTLVLLQALFAIGIVAFSNVPKYGGEKLFMPFFPLFAILAAHGTASALRGLAHFVPWLRRGLPYFLPNFTHTKPSSPRATFLPVAVLGVVAMMTCVPGVVGSVRFHGGYALSYYGELLGGLPGATARGYERTYYDIADKSLARWLDDHAKGRSVHFEPNHKEYVRTYKWLQRDGVVSKRLRLEPRRQRAGLLVLTHERRWSTYPRLLDEHRQLHAVHEVTRDGVPLYTVYERPGVPGTTNTSP